MARRARACVRGGAVTQAKVEIVPTTLTDAHEFVRQHHRHHKPSRGGLFAVAAAVDGRVVGVAVIGRPVARRAQDGWTAEVTRVATDGTANACSALYGAAWLVVLAIAAAGRSRAAARQVSMGGSMTVWPSSDRRGVDPDTVVLHSIIGPSVDEAADRLRRARVSAHALIGQDGEVRDLVPWDRAAWHAGGGRLPPDDSPRHRGSAGPPWGHRGIAPGPWTPLNRRSFGIELVVSSARGAEYSDAQVDALARLLSELSTRYDIRWLATHEAVDRRRLKPRPEGDPLRTDPWRLPDAVWDRCLRALANPFGPDVRGDR